MTYVTSFAVFFLNLQNFYRIVDKLKTKCTIIRHYNIIS